MNSLGTVLFSMGIAGSLILWGYGNDLPLILIGSTCYFIASFALVATRSTLHTWGWIIGTLWIISILFYFWRQSQASLFANNVSWTGSFSLFLITCWILPFLGSSLLFALTFDHNQENDPP